MDGEVEHKDAFKDRALDETPRFVCEKLAQAEQAAASNPNVSTNGYANLYQVSTLPP